MKRIKKVKNGVLLVEWNREHHAIRIVNGKTKNEVSVSNQAFRTTCRTLAAVIVGLAISASPAADILQSPVTVEGLLIKLKGSIADVPEPGRNDYSALFIPVPILPQTFVSTDRMYTDVEYMTPDSPKMVCHFPR